MHKLIDFNSVEKTIIAECISNIPMMEPWIATIIENYVYAWIEGTSTDNERNAFKYKYLSKFGEKDGEYKEWYLNGQLKKDEKYKDGKMIGEYKHYFKNGQLEKEGIVDDYYKVYFLHGELLVDAKMNGECIDYWAPRGGQTVPIVMSVYNRKDGKIHGLFKEYSHDGSGRLVIEAMHVDGKLCGDYKTYHDDGSLSQQSICIDGHILDSSSRFVFHGERKFYHQNGQMLRYENWYNGKLHGIERRWNEDGTLYLEVVNEHGERVATNIQN